MNDLTERNRIILERLRAGASYESIGRELGISRQAVHDAAKRLKAAGYITDEELQAVRRKRGPARDKRNLALYRIYARALDESWPTQRLYDELAKAVADTTVRFTKAATVRKALGVYQPCVLAPVELPEEELRRFVREWVNKRWGDKSLAEIRDISLED